MSIALVVKTTVLVGRPGDFEVVNEARAGVIEGGELRSMAPNLVTAPPADPA